MKTLNLLVLIVVFGLASAANAVLSIGVYEADGVTPYTGRIVNLSDNLELKIISSGGDTGVYAGFALIADTTLGTVGLTGTVTAAAPDASVLVGGAVENVVGGLGANDDGIVGAVNHFSLDPPFGDGVYFEDITFHCEGVGNCVITLYDIGTTWNIADGIIDSVTIIQDIPEPMTMCLLGLGGLFLRRRKTA